MYKIWQLTEGIGLLCHKHVLRVHTAESSHSWAKLAFAGKEMRTVETDLRGTIYGH